MVGLLRADLLNHGGAVLVEVCVHRFEKGFPELVAGSLGAAWVAGLELMLDRGRRLSRFAPVISGFICHMLTFSETTREAPSTPIGDDLLGSDLMALTLGIHHAAIGYKSERALVFHIR